MLFEHFLNNLQKRLRSKRRFRRRSSRIADAAELLEDRALLSGFNENGATLEIDVQASETLQIVSNGATYTLTSSGTWSGTDSGNVTGNGTNLLTVTALGLAAFDTIAVTDSGSASAVTFNDSGASAYTDTITVTLDDAASGAITFNGASPFTGSAALSASTTRNISMTSGSSITTVSGAITLNANQGMTATSGNFVGMNLDNATVTSSSGPITLNGKGGDSGASNYGVRLQNNAGVTGGGAGSVSVTGISGSGTDDDGIILEGSGVSISAVDGDLILNGTTSGPGGPGVVSPAEAINMESGTVVQSTGSGNVTITGNSSNDFDLLAATVDIGPSGTLTLNVDDLGIRAGASFTSSGTGTAAFLIQPRTASTTIGVGGGSGTLNITDAILTSIQDGFSSITIGNSSAGAVDIGSTTLTDSAAIEGGAITVSGTLNAQQNNNLRVRGTSLAVNADVLSSAGSGTAGDGTGRVLLEATSGAITQGGGTVKASNGSVRIEATTGVGTSMNPLLMVTPLAAATSTTSGGVFLSNTGRAVRFESGRTHEREHPQIFHRRCRERVLLSQRAGRQLLLQP
jgi:hypothetical protein